MRNIGLLDDVFDIIMCPLDYPGWTIQGLGMLRLYLDDEQVRRLHIWDPRIVAPGVSTIHDHPWNFYSEILSGFMENQRFELVDGGTAYRHADLRCGVGGGLLSEGEPIGLHCYTREWIKPGMVYAQSAEELHESFPAPGTVSVITRTFHENRDVAHVVWPAGQEWGSAEPRPATEDEILHFCMLARDRWQL